MVLVAAASSDGKNIDLHYGQAHTFYIYALTEDGARFVEKRGLFLQDGHSMGKIQDIAETLKDCGVLLVSQIGPSAARFVLGIDLRVFEAPYPIEPVLEKLRTDILFATHTESGQSC